MTDYVIDNGRSSAYPKEHYGAHFTGSRATFCLPTDFDGLDANVLAIPNLPISVLSASPVIVDSKFLGTHSHYRANDRLGSLSDLTVRSQDMEGGYSRWSKIEYTAGSFSWTNMDAWVDAHYNAGRDLIHVLWGTPAFYSARNTEIGAYGAGSPGASAEPTDMTKWSTYCTAVAQRYAGKIKYYEVWNEPNYNNDGMNLPSTTTGCYFTGTFAKLSEMARRANVAIKAVDPTAKIISPSMTDWRASGTNTAGDFFAGMMAAATDDGSTAMKDWVDIIAVHLYPYAYTTGVLSPNRAQDIGPMIDRIDAAKVTAGVSAKPTWDTESSMIGPSAGSYTDERVCEWMARFLITVAAKGIARTIWYQWDRVSDGYGFINRPIVIAYRESLRKLLMSGDILNASRFTDGRVGYYTNSGLVII